MKYYKKLIGKKCYLSPLNPEEADLFTEWLSDIELTKFLTLIRKTISRDREKEILQQMARDDHVYAIIDLELNKIVGVTGLHNLDYINNCCEFGLFIGDKDYWNQGYGEEASRLLLDFAFNILNMHNVMLLVFDYNTRAIKCYEKIGFQVIGRRRGAYRIAGQTFDIIYMDILDEEFESPYIKDFFSENYEASRKPKKLELV